MVDRIDSLRRRVRKPSEFGIKCIAVSGIPVGAPECQFLVTAGRRKYLCLVNEQGTRVLQRHYKMTRSGLVSVKPIMGNLVFQTGHSITLRTGISPGDIVRIIPTNS
jgi:hypothetical protein